MARETLFQCILQSNYFIPPYNAWWGELHQRMANPHHRKIIPINQLLSYLSAMTALANKLKCLQPAISLNVTLPFRTHNNTVPSELGRPDRAIVAALLFSLRHRHEKRLSGGWRAASSMCWRSPGEDSRHFPCDPMKAL